MTVDSLLSTVCVCAQGRKLPARPAPEGSVSPVGCCHRRWQSDLKVGSETSGGRGQRPPRRLSDRGKPGDTNPLWRACGPSKPPGKSLSAVWAACGPPLFCVSKKKGEKRPEILQKEKKSIGRPTIHPSFPKGLETKKIRQNHPETIQKKRRNAMPRMSRKRREEWDFFLNRRNRITYNDLCRNCRHDCKQSFRAQIVACRKYRSKRSETWR